MKLSVPSEVAQISANLIRSYTLSQFPSWRPFAYKFESKASLMSTNLFVDKPLDIHCRFSNLEFNASDGKIGEIVEETYDIDSLFMVEDLKVRSDFSISGKEERLAQALNPTKLTVYYLFEKGVIKEHDNRQRLGSDSNIVPFASRHTKIDSLGFNIKKLNDGNSEIEFFGCAEKYLERSISEVRDMLCINS